MKAKVTTRQAYDAGRALFKNKTRVAELLLEVASHPETTTEQVMQFVETYRKVCKSIQDAIKAYTTVVAPGQYDVKAAAVRGLRGEFYQTWS